MHSQPSLGARGSFKTDPVLSTRDRRLAEKAPSSKSPGQGNPVEGQMMRQVPNPSQGEGLQGQS